jgi:hypothetical protein
VTRLKLNSLFSCQLHRQDRLITGLKLNSLFLVRWIIRTGHVMQMKKKLPGISSDAPSRWTHNEDEFFYFSHHDNTLFSLRHGHFYISNL